MSEAAYRLTVEGRVQGVGFRYSSSQKARLLRLSGWVRNCRDGSVEIYCEGSCENVEAFIEWLENGGPPYARILNIVKYRAEPGGLYDGFKIEY